MVSECVCYSVCRYFRWDLVCLDVASGYHGNSCCRAVPEWQWLAVIGRSGPVSRVGSICNWQQHESWGKQTGPSDQHKGQPAHSLLMYMFFMVNVRTNISCRGVDVFWKWVERPLAFQRKVWLFVCFLMICEIVYWIIFISCFKSFFS